MTIEGAIARIPAWQRATRLEVTSLPGGVTNLNYRVSVDGEAFVVRLAAEGTQRLGIDRMREARCATIAGGAGLAPEVILALPEEGLLVTRFVAGRHLSEEDMATPAVTARVVRALRRLHGGPPFEDAYSPFRMIDAYLEEAQRARSTLPEDIEILRAGIGEIDRALQQGEAATSAPCHNDLWGPNLIDDGADVRIVDWEYAGNGDLFFDLANYAIYRGTSDAQDRSLLEIYFGSVSDGALTRLKLLQIVAELREALWYVVALTISDRWPDYPAHAARHFSRTRRALDDSRVPTWLSRAKG